MIVSLLLLGLVIFSLGVAFAADEDVALNEVDDGIIVDEEVLSVEEDTNALSETDDSITEAGDSQEVVGVSSTVTKDTFFDYFDNSGALISDADELIFEGDFSDLPISQIMIAGNNPVKFTGNGATFNNVQFWIAQSGVTIDGFNILTNNSNQHTSLIYVSGDDYLSNIVLSNNNLTFIGPENEEAYAIFAGADVNMGTYSISGLQIIGNNITYVGNTDGTAINNVIRVSGDDLDEMSEDITVQGNTFNITIPSVKIPRGYYDEPNPVSEGIVFYYCDDVKFIDNRIDLKYNKVFGSPTDTINIISAHGNMMYMYKDSNIVIKGNEINALGHTLIYGMFISAEDFEISDNKLNISSDTYYAAGINIEGPSSEGIVYNNTISLQVPTTSENQYSVGAAYGIYSEQNFGAIRDVTYKNNTLDLNGYLACGMEIRHCDAYIYNNTITANGNYTYGIAGSFLPTGYNAYVEDNKIYSLGSNNGTAFTGDPILPTNSMGITVLGNCEVKNNEIVSTSVGINAVEDTVKSTIILDNNVINVVANSGKVDNHAIVAEKIDDLTISNNKVTFSGMVDNQFEIIGYDDWGYPIYNTTKNTRTYGIYVKDSNAVIKNNDFLIAVPTFAVNWGAVRESFSEGIVLVGCDDVVFEDNNVTISSNGGSSWDTIYGIDILNSANPSVKNNNITINGAGYTYAIIINDENFTISKNNISVTSDEYACGIDVEGAAKGVIDDNTITASAINSVYPIYTGMVAGKDVIVNITNNNIEGTGYYVVGLEIAAKKALIEKNNVYVDGNHTIGVGAKVSDLTINDNAINAFASNEGDQPVWDGLGTANSGIKIIEGNASITNNTIASNAIGINVDSTNDIVLIDNNTIVVNANSGKVDNYAIVAEEIDDLTIVNNDVSFSGMVDNQFVIIGYDDWGYPIYDSSNNTRAYGVFIKNSNAVIKNNDFDIAIPTFAVNWGTGRDAFSEGIVLVGCDDVIFDYNNVTLTTNGGSSWDTIYGIDVLNSARPSIEGNNITVDGAGYTYAIIINDEGFIISGNDIDVTSDEYACGIDVEGTAEGQIVNNNISAIADNSAYPIYSGMNYAPVDIVIEKNNISGDAYYVVGIEVGGNKALIEDNEIKLSGNHTIGIGAYIDEITINNNIIVSDASNEGDVPIWDNMGTDTTGIKIAKGNFSITNNDIETTGDYAAILGDNDGNITNNDLLSSNGAGNNAIIGLGDINATGNPETKNKYIKVILVADEFTKVYESADQFIVKVLDENGQPVGNKTIKLIIDGVVYTTISDFDGNAAFDIDLVPEEYGATVKFDGDSEYGFKSIVTMITVTKKPIAFTAPNKSLLVTATKSGSNYKIVLKDNSGKVLAGKKVTITFNGKTSTATTNAKGEITYKLVATKAGSYKLTLKFAGDDKYAAATKTATIKVSKEASKLTAKAKKFKKSQKVKKYAVTLKDSKGKAIKKAKLTLKVKGKTFKATTNAKGKATFKIKKLNKKGKYTAKVTFAGNNLYNKAVKSVKITVKK